MKTAARVRGEPLSVPARKSWGAPVRTPGTRKVGRRTAASNNTHTSHKRCDRTQLYKFAHLFASLHAYHWHWKLLPRDRPSSLFAIPPGM